MRLLALALLATLLAAPALAADAPRVAVGDYWDSRGTFTLGGETATVTRRAEVVALEPVAIADGPFDAIRWRSVETITQERDGAPVTVATTTVDEWSAADGSGTLRAVETLAQRDESLVTTFEYVAPCKRAPSPLAVGATRRFACDVDATRNGKTTRIVEAGNATVAREERIVVPAGAFDAFVVETEKDGCPTCKDVRWSSAEACREVKKTSTGPQGETFSTELVAYRCSSAAAGGAGTTVVPAFGVAAFAAAGAAALCAKRRKRS